MTKEDWKKYYKHLLDKNLVTIEGLKEKYEDYEQYREDWLRSDSRGSYENGQEAMLEILIERGAL